MENLSEKAFCEVDLMQQITELTLLKLSNFKPIGQTFSSSHCSFSTMKKEKNVSIFL